MKEEETWTVPDQASLPDHDRFRFEIQPQHGGEASSSFAISKKSCRREQGDQSFLLVGRQAKTVDLRIQDGSISRKHAVIYVMQDKVFLQDLGGKHGTTVNGERIRSRETRQLEDGDHIQFGSLGVDSTYTLRIVSRSDASNDEDLSQQLSGRAKRQAEIDAMTASLDEKPTYQTYEDPQMDITSDTVQPLTSKQLKRASKFRIPVSQYLEIESESDRSNLSATCVAIDPAGARFAVGSMDTLLRLYDFGGMNQVKQHSFKVIVPEDGHPVVDCCYSNTGDKMAVATGSVQPVILGRHGQEIVKFVRGDMYVTDQTNTHGHTAAVNCVQWHPLERDIVLTGSDDGSARLWNLSGKRHFDNLVCEKVFPVKNEKGQRVAVKSIAFHPGGKEFAVGTVHGSIQIFNTSRASARPERLCYNCHGEGKSVDALVYDAGGTLLVSRSAEDSACKVWNHLRISSSASPLVVCQGVSTQSKIARVAVNPEGSVVCVPSTELVPSLQGGNGAQMGKLHFFRIKPAKANVINPILTVDTRKLHVLDVKWHGNVEQIFCTCSDGSSLVFFDTEMSSMGALQVVSKRGKASDSLSELLKTKALSDPTLMTGQIVAPFASSNRGRKRKGEEIEPERPAVGKHREHSHAAGGSSTLQQYVASKHIVKTASVAGTDPREALSRYRSDSDANQERLLADKTLEEENGDLS